MKEIWKDIEGYVGCYQVSSLGRVKSLGNGGSNSKERIMKAQLVSSGYFAVTLSKDGKQKQYLIHRLAANAFIPNPDNLPQVNHRDEDKTNNIVDNLEFCSAKYNSNYGTHNKRISESMTNNTKMSKKVLCIETGKIYPSTMQVERELGFSNSDISKCCRGIKHKTVGGFHWCYI